MVMMALKPQIEGILQKFQQDLIAWQSKITMVWNTMNVILKVLMEKGIITEDEFAKAGEALMTLIKS